MDMLPERSTHDYKNLGAESIHSKLSVAMFIREFQEIRGIEKSYYIF